MDGIERYYEISQSIYAACSILITAYCYVLWVRPFVAGRVWLAGVVYAAFMLAIDFVPLYIPTVFAYAVGTAAAFFVMCAIDREYIGQKFFLAVAFYCLRWQSWRIVGCISNESLGTAMRLFPDRGEMFWFKYMVASDVADSVTAFLLMYGAVRFLQKAYGSRREHMKVKELFILVMPSVAGVSAYGVIRFYNDVYERDTGKSVFDLYVGHDLLILLYAVICYVTILTMTYVFRQWKNEQEEDRQRDVLARQMQDMERHIAEVERLYRDIRRLRHDMGNHLMTLEQLYGRGAYEEAAQYTESLKEEMGELSSEASSGNPVTDAILSGRKKEMEEKGILFTCDFHYPANGAVNAFDVSIILNNALANAVEAAEREREKTATGKSLQGKDVKDKDVKGKDMKGKDVKDKDTQGKNLRGSNLPRVSLSSCCIKNMYMIEVANSYTGELAVDASSGLIPTSKPGGGHGFGLVNIRHVAHKYLGEMEVGQETRGGERVFVLRVMMQMMEESAAHNQ